MQVTTIPRTKIMEMLKFEQMVRYSPEIQRVYTQQYLLEKTDPSVRSFSIESEIQKYVLNHFGYKDSDLEEYWKIPKLYWHDEEVKNSIFYMKLNIFSYGDLKVGDKMIDVPLYDFVSTSPLTSKMTDKPLIILAGSMT